MKIKSIIVDDEKIARDVVANYLEKYCPVVEVIGQAQHIKEAVPMIQSLQPQLVFLDVEMPFGNAFDILEACEGIPFETIFITAYSEYSLKALNLSAAYYILKPIDITELVAAVNKVQLSLLKSDEFNRNKILLQNLRSKPELQQIALPTLHGFDIIKTASITRLQAKGNFTEVYFTDGSFKLICKFLKHFDELLDAPFIRIHRSYIVNSNFIKSYSKSAGGYVTLHDGTEIEVSTTYKEHLLKMMGV
ncbi:LytR/AlgR family response regulator transcription factor [Ferruginibacter albus]|uniref:LytR/AlgR family response regulator transcription factor n=1 Tax=Ferruginibacter albus TaxID=2875540 RepID=UPI001CC47DB1|nr:LytTR family DNA-binding domain-containing protein [Ferruginibacter albus]UAY52183.1 LytTR family DNA-binding domain-containing protein [Ferruginibacter albus]